MSRHYLDHASTCPTRPVAVEAMLPWLSAPGDPGRIHAEGTAARAAVESAREQVAAMVGARPREVVFTSGATEAINAAVWGATEHRSQVVCSAVEHSAVRDSSQRHSVSWVGADRLGRIEPGEVARAMGPETALVHVQWGNHEVGTLQPVDEIVAACRDAGILVHVDAAAAAGHVPIDFDASDADLMSISAHKFGGPPGVGALLIRRGLRIRALLVGGEQERARRGGFENVPGCVGFGAVCASLAGQGQLESESRTASIQTARVLAALEGLDGVTVYGDTERRLPHLVCFGVDDLEAEGVLLGLDQAGIAVHSGSACSSESLEPSPVLAAMGVDADHSLRVSVGWSTTDDDIDAFSAALPVTLDKLRSLRA